jgi:hypothetical protein
MISKELQDLIKSRKIKPEPRTIKSEDLDENGEEKFRESEEVRGQDGY